MLRTPESLQRQLSDAITIIGNAHYVHCHCYSSELCLNTLIHTCAVLVPVLLNMYHLLY